MGSCTEQHPIKLFLLEVDARWFQNKILFSLFLLVQVSPLLLLKVTIFVSHLLIGSDIFQSSEGVKN